MLLNPASVSVFLPAFNDETTIGKLVSEALVLLKSVTSNYEIIIINGMLAYAIVRLIHYF